MGIILIVDDEYLIADLLGCCLEDEGYSVVKACSGAEGLKLLARDKPDLVITDYMMPGMDGAEFARSIKATPGFKTLPILLMTGGHSENAQSTPGLFTKIVSKPFSLATMLSLVADLLGPASSKGA